MSPLKAFTRRRPTGEDGIGMILVVSSMMVASIFAVASLGYALNTQAASGKNQGWNGALAAAQAGVDDYIAYLNRNDNYARTPIDCTNIAIRTPANCSMPFGWKPIDASNPSLGAFHYDIDPAKLESDGIVQVTSTGRVGSKTRTLQVGVGRGGSTDFLYYTDHEDADPNNKQAYSGTMDPRCALHWWEGTGNPKTRPGSWGCQEIQFASGDVLDGPVHSNDTLYMSASSPKPKFLQGVETSDPKCKLAIAGTPSTYSNCDRFGSSADYGSSWPSYSDPKDLPDNSDQFRNFPGCHYQGATRIKFLAAGTMQVWSKESTTTLTSTTCGRSGTTAPNGAIVSVPTDQVIYVRGGTAGEHQCLSGEIGDGLPLGTYTATNKATTFPGYTYDANMLLETQRCGKGNVYVEGVLKGRVTLAASNSITMTGDVVLADGIAGTDMLGLVAANSVEVYHPRMDTWFCTEWRSSNTVCRGSWRWDGDTTEVTGWPHRYNDVDRNNVPYPTKGIQISGSIQTLQRSFFVQSYQLGPKLGSLYVRGSIAQEWRGIVGTGGATGTGYLKDYHYDKRLRYASPPYFPQWTNAVWASNYTGEIAPLYS